MAISSKITAYVPAMPSMGLYKVQIGQYSGRIIRYVKTSYSSIQIQFSNIAISAKSCVMQMVSQLFDLTLQHKRIGLIGVGLLIGSVVLYKSASDTEPQLHNHKHNSGRTIRHYNRIKQRQYNNHSFNHHSYNNHRHRDNSARTVRHYHRIKQRQYHNHNQNNHGHSNTITSMPQPSQEQVNCPIS